MRGRPSGGPRLALSSGRGVRDTLALALMPSTDTSIAGARVTFRGMVTPDKAGHVV
jgi:hypothetical protein